MATLVQQITDLATALGTDYKTLNGLIGSLASLTTTNKTSLVAAINEVMAGQAQAGAQIDDSGPSTQKVYSSSKTENLLGGRVPTSRTVNGKALSGDITLLWTDFTGQIPSSALPSIAISDVFTVASQAAMLALTAQRGDVAVRTDLGKTFILSTEDPTTLANWIEMPSIGQVSSVAGRTGAVTLAIADISGLQSALDGKASTAAATSSAAGLVQLATTAQATAGTDNTTAMTPADVRAVVGDQNTNFVSSYNTAKS